MKHLRIVALLTALLVVPLSLFAMGAGGFMWGGQLYTGELANFDLRTSTTGVFGYSVTPGGQRIGGFALAMNSIGANPGLQGGFVGAITGQETAGGPLVGAVTLFTGLGGLAPDATLHADGSFALFGELDLELAFHFIPGAALTGYAGMQVISDLGPGRSPFENILYTPVLGMRFAWGSF